MILAISTELMFRQAGHPNQTTFGLVLQVTHSHVAVNVVVGHCCGGLWRLMTFHQPAAKYSGLSKITLDGDWASENSRATSATCYTARHHLIWQPSNTDLCPAGRFGLRIIADVGEDQIPPMDQASPLVKEVADHPPRFLATSAAISSYFIPAIEA